MKHVLLLVPGLGDNIYQLQWLQNLWKKDGIQVIIHTAPWKKTEENFQTKLKRLLQHIDTLTQPHTKISLAGASAGGSLVINAFAKRKNKIHKVINVCGRVRKGTNVFPTLKQAAREFSAFAESVVVCEENLKHFSPKDKVKIMTIQPFLYDAIVPMSCIPIKGATNISVSIPFHMFGIAGALTLCRKKLTQFILQ